MELKVGNKVTIALDEEVNDNWYVFIDQKNGFALREGYNGQSAKGCLIMNHKKLQAHVAKALKLNEDETHNFLIAGKPTTINGDKTKYWGLLLKTKV